MNSIKFFKNETRFSRTQSENNRTAYSKIAQLVFRFVIFFLADCVQSSEYWSLKLLKQKLQSCLQCCSWAKVITNIACITFWHFGGLKDEGLNLWGPIFVLQVFLMAILNSVCSNPMFQCKFVSLLVIWMLNSQFLLSSQKQSNEWIEFKLNPIQAQILGIDLAKVTCILQQTKLNRTKPNQHAIPVCSRYKLISFLLLLLYYLHHHYYY